MDAVGGNAAVISPAIVVIGQRRESQHALFLSSIGA